MKFWILIFVSLFIPALSLSQEISSIQYPSEVVKGEKFSIMLNLYTNPRDTIYIITSTDGDFNLSESFVIDDSLFKIDPVKTESKFLTDGILKTLPSEKTLIFPDTFAHTSVLRKYIFIGFSKTQGNMKINFLPVKLHSNSLIFNPAYIKVGQIEVDVKGSTEKSAGLCAKFEKNGFIKFNVDQKFSAKNGFVLSFWIKTTSMRAKVITLNSSNDKGFLSVGIKLGNIVFSLSNSIGRYEINLNKFVSDGEWHNIIICADQSNNILKFFIDGEKIDEVFIPNLNLFEINAPIAKIEHGPIDEIVLFKTFKPELIERLPRYFVKFDSNAVFLLKFENETVDVLGNVSGVEFNEVKLIPSSAPLCSPEVRISAELKGNNVNVNWEVDDPTFVDKFIVERKIGDGFYQQIYQAPSLNQKRYSFTDVISENNVIYYYRVKRVNKNGSFEFSDEVKIGLGLNKDFEIIGNFPNPFNSETKIIYNLFNDTYVKLTVYDIVGREIAILVDGFQNAGRHEATFDLNNVKVHEITSGIYFYKLQTQRGYEVRKMIVIK
jgi:hypothetical protein